LLGYNVEYSSVAFALFFIGEYAHIVFASTFSVVVFLGGWQPPTGTFERAFLFILTPSIVYPLDFLIHLPQSLETYPSFAYGWLMLIHLFDWIVSVILYIKVALLFFMIKSIKLLTVLNYKYLYCLVFFNYYLIFPALIYKILFWTGTILFWFAIYPITFIMSKVFISLIYLICATKFKLFVQFIFVVWTYLMLVKYKEQITLYLSKRKKWLRICILAFLVGFTLTVGIVLLLPVFGKLLVILLVNISSFILPYCSFFLLDKIKLPMIFIDPTVKQIFGALCLYLPYISGYLFAYLDNIYDTFPDTAHKFYLLLNGIEIFDPVTKSIFAVHTYFIIKVNVIIFIFILARAALPRFRYDQLMRLGWKVFLPLSLLFTIFTATLVFCFGGFPPVK